MEVVGPPPPPGAPAGSLALVIVCGGTFSAQIVQMFCRFDILLRGQTRLVYGRGLLPDGEILMQITGFPRIISSSIIMMMISLKIILL